jgi:hypothetical protein
MIVLSRSPASTISDDANGGQTAASPVDLLSHCADAFQLARSAVSEVGSCTRAQVELHRKYHKEFGRYADVYPVNRCAFEEMRTNVEVSVLCDSVHPYLTHACKSVAREQVARLSHDISASTIRSTTNTV